MSRRVREALLGYALVLPALLVFGTFIFYPFVRTAWLGLFEQPLFGGDSTWVGLDQYLDEWRSDDFRNSLFVTVKFAVFTVPVGISLGVLLAVVGHQRLRGIGVYRTIFSSTVATSIAVASVLFFTLFNQQLGVLTKLLNREGETPVLDDPRLAFIAVCGVTIWQNLGLSFIVISAGLQAVPDELLEAARVDGAGAFRRFFRVTMPLLSPTLLFAVVVGSILAFQAFAQVDLLTEGGPGDRTNVLTYAIKTTALGNPPDQGAAAAYAMALFAITLLLTVVQLRFLERRVTYER
ncbi:MAG: sugar ABC transporter permease [Actinomycetota bacterium]|nr:sugar ABC transporter permease [Actinomycetota bacterium]